MLVKNIMYLVFLLVLLVDGVHLDRGDECIEWEVGWGDSSKAKEPPVFRVVNGQPANLGDVPYQVALRLPIPSIPSIPWRYKSFCGGALIGSDRLLTAAHCFHSLMPNNYSLGAKNVSQVYAVAGSILNIDRLRPMDSASGGQWRRLRSVQRPYGYSFPDNDIALVVTVNKFKFNDFVSPIAFATSFGEYQGECLVAGYGRTSTEALIHSEVLLIAFLQPISVSECSRLYRRNMSRFVCTSTTLADVAKGDSGGPLVCRNTGDDNEAPLGLLVGVISASATVRLTGGRKQQVVRSAFFTRVSDYAMHFSKPAPVENHAAYYQPRAVWTMIIYVTLLSS